MFKVGDKVKVVNIKDVNKSKYLNNIYTIGSALSEYYTFENEFKNIYNNGMFKLPITPIYWVDSELKKATTDDIINNIENKIEELDDKVERYNKLNLGYPFTSYKNHLSKSFTFIDVLEKYKLQFIGLTLLILTLILIIVILI